MTHNPVLATTEARDALSKTLARFRREGPSARPLLFGSHRKAEAVVLPMEEYERLEQIAEQAHFEQAEDVQRILAEYENDPHAADRRVRRRKRHA